VAAMIAVIIEAERADKDLLAAELYEAGTLGLIERDLPANRSHIEAFFQDGAGMAALRTRFSAYGAIVRREESTDWVRAARELWKPLLAGERFFLAPSWC